jgi:hypothetical protein
MAMPMLLPETGVPQLGKPGSSAGTAALAAALNAAPVGHKWSAQHIDRNMVATGSLAVADGQ